MSALLTRLVDPSVKGQAALQRASSNGHGAVLELLLAHPLVDPCWDNQAAIRAAAEGGHAAAVRVLLADPRVDPSVNRQAALRSAAERGHAAVLELFLAHPLVDPVLDDQAAFLSAVEGGHAAAVRVLLADSRVDLSVQGQAALCSAAKGGHAAVLDLLLAHPLVDPCWEDQAAIRLAAEGGHAAAVRVLLNDPRVKPSRSEKLSGCVALAAASGNLALMEQFLANKIWNPPPAVARATLSKSRSSLGSAFRLFTAAQHRVRVATEQMEAAHKRLSDLQADVRWRHGGVRLTAALMAGCRGGHLDVVQRLLPLVDPLEYQDGLHEAAAGGCVGVVKVLLETGFVDPTFDDGSALLAAARYGHDGVVAVLARDVDTTKQQLQNAYSSAGDGVVCGCARVWNCGHNRETYNADVRFAVKKVVKAEFVARGWAMVKPRRKVSWDY